MSNAKEQGDFFLAGRWCKWWSVHHQGWKIRDVGQIALRELAAMSPEEREQVAVAQSLPANGEGWPQSWRWSLSMLGD